MWIEIILFYAGLYVNTLSNLERINCGNIYIILTYWMPTHHRLRS